MLVANRHRVRSEPRKRYSIKLEGAGCAVARYIVEFEHLVGQDHEWRYLRAKAAIDRRAQVVDPLKGAADAIHPRPGGIDNRA